MGARPETEGEQSASGGVLMSVETQPAYTVGHCRGAAPPSAAPTVAPDELRLEW